MAQPQGIAKESIEIMQMFETAAAVLMRGECQGVKEGVENTASYKFLIQTLVDMNNVITGRKSDEIPEVALKGLQYALNLLIKIDCEQLTTKVLVQIVPSATYLNLIADPAKV